MTRRGRDGGRVDAARSAASPLALLLLLGLLALAATGCGGGEGTPTFVPLDNKTVDVGKTLEFDVIAKDATSLEAKNLPEGARFDVLSGGEGRFTWSPLISQTGEHSVDFFATNKQGQSSARIQVDVSGGCDGPEIISPTTWVVEEQDDELQRSIRVKENHCAKELSWETGELPDGMTVTPLVNRATVHWKPAAKQWNKQQEYQFEVTVTNNEGKSTSEVIVIKLGEECPGTPAPNVESTTPSAQQGQNDFPVTAQVTAEEESDVEETILFYALGEDPDPSQFQTVPMNRRNDMSDVFEAAVSLDEDLQDGESVDVTYKVCAENRDDSGERTCSVQSCTDELTFTAQMGTAGGLCTACERDGECGGPTDRCVSYGPTSAHCGLDCSSTGSCPRGYECTDVLGGHEQCVRNVDCGSSGMHRAAASGDLVVNEILVHPTEDANGDGTTSGTADQFIEFVSTANEIVDVSKYELQKGNDKRWSFPAGTTVAPGQSVVVFGGGKPADFQPMGTDLVFSARTDRADVGILQFKRAGDTVRLVDRDGKDVVVQTYGEQSDKMPDDIANQGESITRAPQVEGSSWTKHSSAPGAGGAKQSPGTTSCGKNYPIEVNGGCGGEHCLGRATDKDVKGNDSPSNAVCISNIPVKIQGELDYVWREPDAPGPDPEDYFEVKLESGDRLFVGTFPGPSPDVYNTKLQILSSGGKVLEENLHRHEVRDWYSEINPFVASSDGSYYIRVSTPRGKTRLKGSYMLRIEPATN